MRLRCLTAVKVDGDFVDTRDAGADEVVVIRTLGVGTFASVQARVVGFAVAELDAGSSFLFSSPNGILVCRPFSKATCLRPRLRCRQQCLRYSTLLISNVRPAFLQVAMALEAYFPPVASDL